MQRIEPLENRIAPAAITVTNTNDSGPGSLREAILNANASVGSDSITFDFPNEVVSVIHLASPLPVVTESLKIDGTSEMQPSRLPGVQLDGTGVAGSGLSFASDLPLGQFFVAGLSITGFAEHGIDATAALVEVSDCVIGLAADGITPGTNHRDGIHLALIQSGFGSLRHLTVAGNDGAGLSMKLLDGSYAELSDSRIGTDYSGTVSRGNGQDGIYVEKIVGSGLSIAASVVSGNGGYGVHSVAGELSVDDSFIGTDVSGSFGLGNHSGGLLVEGAGSSFYGQRNVISGNHGHGLVISGIDGHINVSASMVGTSRDGNSAIPNSGDGILITGSINSSLPYGRFTGPFSITGSVISGNQSNGLELLDSTQVSVTLTKIGVNGSGDSALPNGGNGVLAHSSADGELSPVYQQLTISNSTISGNTGYGIRHSAGYLAVAGCRIGASSSGATAIGNMAGGILVEGGAEGFSTDTNEPGAINVISGNGGHGIEVTGSHLSLLMINNSRVGVDLGGLSAIPNDGDGIFIHNLPSSSFFARSIASGNIVSGNSAHGIEIEDVDGVFVTNAIIGTAIGGREGIPNGGNGIFVHGQTDKLTVASNTVSGNIGAGIVLQGHATDTRIENNIIGVSSDYSVKVPNSAGIIIDHSGGQTYIWNNVIGGNRGDGIALRAGFQTSLGSNFVGVTKYGTNIGNEGNGISLENSSESQVYDNVIGFNQGNGILIGAGTKLPFIARNRIGYGTFAMEKYGNGGAGIYIDGGSGATIQGGVIAFNGSSGIVIKSGTGNQIAGTTVFSNAGQDIDLGGDGPTPNDEFDGDTGANGLQNSPLLASAIYKGAGTVQVQGTLAGQPGRTYSIEVTVVQVDGTKGQLSLPITATADAFGVAHFTVPCAVKPDFALSKFVALATDLTTGDTSEYSNQVSIGGNTLSAKPVVDTVLEGDSSTKVVQFTVSLLAPATGTVSVSYSTAGTAIADVDYKPVSGSITFAPGEISHTVAVKILSDTKLEADKTLSLQLGDLTGSDVTLGSSLPLTIVDDDTSLVVSKNGKSATWLDVDGDTVSLRVTKPILHTGDFVLARDPITGGERLESLSLANLSSKPGAAGVDLSITAKRPPANRINPSDGLVHIGTLDGTGRNFGSILIDGSLESFSGGGVTRLQATGLGSTSSMEPTSNSLHSIDITGPLVRLQISGDVENVALHAHSIGKVVIGGNLSRSALVSDRIGSVNIGGDIQEGIDSGAALISSGNLGPLDVHGSIAGRSSGQPVLIQAGAGPGGIAHFVSLSVTGSVIDAQLLAGGSERGNADMGPVRVSGNWEASILAAGMDSGVDGVYGTEDDRPGGTQPGNSPHQLISKIAQVTIKGTVSGTEESGDRFGFFAQRIGAVRIGGSLTPPGLIPGTSDTFLSIIANGQAQVA